MRLTLFTFGEYLILLGLVGILFMIVSKRPKRYRTWSFFGMLLVVTAGVFAILLSLESTGRLPRSAVDGITLLLALVAIAFALWQFRDSRVQEARMERLAREMSTRFVGFFPNNLPDINEVVEHANEKLDVMADYVGYGHFSWPEEFQRYFRKLQDLAGKQVKIRMLVLTREEAERTYATQFTDKEFREQLMEKDSRLARYCDAFACGFGAEFNERKKERREYTEQELLQLRKDFDRFMFDRQLFYMKDLIERGVEIKQTDDKIPFFLWCKDGHEAVFGFLHEHSANEREVSFRTRDGSLIEHTFAVKFKALWDQAKEIEMITVEGHAVPNWLPGSSAKAAKPALAAAAAKPVSSAA